MKLESRHAALDIWGHSRRSKLFNLQVEQSGTVEQPPSPWDNAPREHWPGASALPNHTRNIIFKCDTKFTWWSLSIASSVCITATSGDAVDVSKEPQFFRVDPEDSFPKRYSYWHFSTLSCLLPSYSAPLGRHDRIKRCTNWNGHINIRSVFIIIND
jgi:hypothetical protein